LLYAARQTKTKSKAFALRSRRHQPLAQSKPTVHLRDLLGAGQAAAATTPQKIGLKKENLWDSEWVVAIVRS